MLLAIDAGNTQTVVGLFRGHDLVDHWRIATDADRTSDELALMIQQFLGFHGFSFALPSVDVSERSELPEAQLITGVAICSGVPRVTAELRQMTERYFGFPALVLEPGVRTGMPILYDNPKEVGADRIANAVGAYDLYGGPQHHRRLRHRDHDRGGQRGRGVPRGRDLPRRRDRHGRPVRSGRRAAARRAPGAEARDRQVDRRIDPVGQRSTASAPRSTGSSTASQPSSASAR